MNLKQHTVEMEPDISALEAACRGDREAFARLVNPLRPRLHAFALRMVADVQDAEDVIQDALLKAYLGLRSFRKGSSFSTWVFSIVTRCCLDHLRSRRRWREDAQHHARTDPEVPHDAVLQQLRQPSARFEAREHLAFCFSCVGRSLPPEEAASVLLREVFGFSNREAAVICDISESVLRHRLAAGRQAMQDTFEGLCGLVAKDGVCHQCTGLRDRAPLGQQGDPPPDLSGTRDDSWSRRIAAVQTGDLEAGSSAQLHHLMFRIVRQVEEKTKASRNDGP